MANLDVHKMLEGESSKRIKEKPPQYSTIKITKEVKVLFDELTHQYRKKQVDLIEDLLIEWCKHQDEDIYERYKNHELPGQKNNIRENIHIQVPQNNKKSAFLIRMHSLNSSILELKKLEITKLMVLHLIAL
ncbi:TPA: hypothetical protein ACHHFR_002759 [Staphylococcus aureus]|nr:hypothetical protein [Staphylococcus aureus]HDH4923701.1 hypothetical protein [Staphylococcus aureus]HEI8037297.1 hypothetical protein [Staphylococcus aureus]